MANPFILFLGLLLIPLSAMADEVCDEDLLTRCRSQLLRVTVAPDALNMNEEAVLPLLRKLSDSPSLQTLLESSYDIPDVSMPPDETECLREKAEGDPAFQNVNCSDKDLCNRPGLSPELKQRLCFNLPCSLLAGPDVAQCPEQSNVGFTSISFTEPLKIEKIRFTPTTVDFKDNKAKLCFRITELSLNINTRLNFDNSGTQLRDNGISLSNVRPTLDGPREICAVAPLNLSARPPVGEIQVIPQGDGPFISNDMIKKAAADLRIQGLSGYKPEDIERIKTDLVPRLFHPVRDSVEEGVSEALGEVFTEELQKIFNKGGTSFVDGRSYISELGIQNMEVLEQMKIVECSQLREATNYQRSHAFHLKTPESEEMVKRYEANFERKCKYPGGLHPVYNTEYVPTYPAPEARAKLADLMRGKNITSESVKQRLIALKEVMLEEPASGRDHVMWHPNEQSRQRHLEQQRQRMMERYEREIAPLVSQIEKAQTDANLPNLIGRVLDGRSPTPNAVDFGLSLPEICNDLGASPMANKRIPNCPIQVYADLNQFNGLLKKMWENGQLCMKGKGPSWRGSGASRTPNPEPCTMEMGGMTCRLDSAPQLKADRNGRYKVSVQLKRCSRPPAFLIFGAFGGDINIDYTFKPKACENGDFCIDEPDPNWSVVEGTESGALRPKSAFNTTVRNGLDAAINGALGKVIRIPMASAVSGPLADVPLRAEGRVDSGPGYFGACLEVDTGSAPR